MSLRILRTAVALVVLASPACVVRLTERNAPLPNGGVSGPSADCSKVQALPRGAPGADVKTKFVGRYDFTNPDRPVFDWSGNIMSARFEGTEVTWGIDLVPPAKETRETIFEVTIDGVAEEVILGGGQPNTKTHTVPSGVHEITVIRSSEALFGVVALVPFTFGGGKQLPPTERPRRIEYIGDSITCGYGNEGPNATCPYNITVRKVGEAEVKIPKTQNMNLAYGTLAAKALDADAVTVCFSGKGVVLNYREVTGEYAPLLPGEDKDPDARTTIPQYYLRMLATTREEAPPPPPAVSNLWDFSKEPEPSVVVINIGQNDFGRDVNQDTIADGIDVDRFREGYKDFVKFVRSKRPNAHIFIAVSPMVTDKFPIDNARRDFRNSLNRIVAELSAAGDNKLYSFELVEMGSRYGLGCDYHPNLEVHRIMAEQVAGAIRSKTCW